MRALKEELDTLARKSPETLRFCGKVLRSERYGGSAVLMVVDAAITSVGVNYFSVVVPRVLQFKEKFVDSGEISTLEDLVRADESRLYSVWRNRRSWSVAKGVAEELLEHGDGVEALRRWASKAELESWREWLKVSGAGINTFQYLRMMGGVDTVMPDRIVRRFVERHVSAPKNQVEFVRFAEDIARDHGYMAVELCWLSWLSSYDDERIRKYSALLEKI
ncbi:hypothetical protein [Geoglobus ahangari]